MNENQFQIVWEAFEKILGPPSKGALAYCRFFEKGVIEEICSKDRPLIGGWMMYVVGSSGNANPILISADQAVEKREDKGEPTLLIVDNQSAGAGMDGIYSAGKEIKESEFYDLANEIARKTLEHGDKTLAKKAVIKARKLGTRNHISPFQIFNFFSKCAELKSIGASLGYLGLWPIKDNGKLDERELDKSVKMIQKLFLQSNATSFTTSIIGQLLLKGASDQQKKDLTELIREASSRPWRESALIVTEKENLWLNCLNPGIFDLDILQKIEIIPWRSKNQKPTVWSGLKLLKDGGLLEFVINREAVKKTRGSKLEIRWKTSPENLAHGACEYNIQIISGTDVLAEKRISHSAKNPQRLSFNTEDFEEMEDSAKFEAKVCVKAIGGQDIQAQTEDFILRVGASEEKSRSSSANQQRSLIEAAISIEDSEDFEKVMREHQNADYYTHDKKGYITVRHQAKSGKVFCPPLVTAIEQDWSKRKGAVGRWKIKIRADGERVGDPEFLEIPKECSDSLWTRLCKASEKVCCTLSSGCGMLGLIYGPDKGLENYVNSWLDVFETKQISAALAGTVEVQSLNEETIGLIVLPVHPVRMAWHQGYDMLLKHARYDLKLSPSKIREAVKFIDGAHFPAFLPGLEAGRSFVFGDVLNFYFVAMVADHDPEPKASVAMMALALSEGKQFIAQSAAQATAEALSTEVTRYARLYPNYDTLRVHSLRPGDGMTLGRALGKSLENIDRMSSDEDELESIQNLGFVLELFPSDTKTSIVGRFFSSITDASRSGFGGTPREDKWIIENRRSPGGVRRPKLIWAKRTGLIPNSTAHIAIAFDTFDSVVQTCNPEELPNEENPVEVYGLVLGRQRIFALSPQPNWKTFVVSGTEGEKHPVNRGLTDRLLKIHRSNLRMTSINMGGSSASWPTLSTNISLEKEESLKLLHNLCDWVVTVDRNAAIEYFDSPNRQSSVYEAYIIQCVPEREDLEFLQLVTSTTNIEEILGRLEEALTEMGVSSSPKNCIFLMNQLKSLSGRFAMRLATGGNVAQEMVAIAYANALSLESLADEPVSPSLRKGFYVPIDDVPKILELPSDPVDLDKTRSDLLYVSINPKGGFQFIFVEIKYRRYLRTARTTEITTEIHNQLGMSRKKWGELYGDKSSPFEKAINRSKLARILTFYAEKGIRHYLDQLAYDQLMKEIKKMNREGDKYVIDKIEEAEHLDRGYIFCPEYLAKNATNISMSGEQPIWLFGPKSVSIVPPVISYDSPSAPFENSESQTPSYKGPNKADTPEIGSQDSKENRQEPKRKNSEIILGRSEFTDDPVSWTIDIRSNPHLMVVGLPGMGKTTCLINLCLQMIQAQIYPIVFSYHKDIDDLLEKKLGDNLHFVDFAGLGFNPLEVVGDVSHAYVDNTSMLRDIFRSIFPDLGDIQLGALREAFKKSYTDLGWDEFDGKSNRPPFRNSKLSMTHFAVEKRETQDLSQG